MRIADFNHIFQQTQQAIQEQSSQQAGLIQAAPAASSFRALAPASVSIPQEQTVGGIVINPAGFLDANTVDSTQVVPNAVPGVNLVQNSGLESGDWRNWTTGYEQIGAPSYAISPDAYSGDWSGSMTAGSGVGGAVVSDAFAVIPGDIYYMSVQVKASVAGASGFYFRALFGTTSDFQRTDAGVTSQDVVANGSLTTSWAKYEGFVEVPAGASFMRVAVYRWTGAITGTTYFDEYTCTRQGLGFSNGPQEVYVDATGITIKNGKLTFEDQFGNNVVTGDGFGPSWLQYIDSRFYNSRFEEISLSSMVASEIGGGTPTANYQASLNAQLPYYVINQLVGGAVAQGVADASAPSGYALDVATLNTSQKMAFYQDIPVEPLTRYHHLMVAKATDTLGQPSYYLYGSWRAADHSIIGAEFTFSTSSYVPDSGWSLISNAIASTPSNIPDQSPANAAYLRVKVSLYAVYTLTAHTRIGAMVLYQDPPDMYHDFLQTGILTTTTLNVEDSSSNLLTIQTAAKSSNSTLSTTDANMFNMVVGATGLYVVIVNCDVSINTASLYMEAHLWHSYGGWHDLGAPLIYSSATTGRLTVSKVWVVPLVVGEYLQVNAHKTASGSATMYANQTTMTAIPILS